MLKNSVIKLKRYECVYSMHIRSFLGPTVWLTGDDTDPHVHVQPAQAADSAEGVKIPPSDQIPPGDFYFERPYCR